MDAAVEPLKARRLYLLLRDRIVSGEFAPAERLPGENVLAAEYGLSRMTVRRALGLLTKEGVIVRRAGSGTFVKEVDYLQPMTADLSNALSRLTEMGRRTDVRLLSFGYVKPPKAIAESLRLAPGERTQRSVRVRLIDGTPFSYLTAHVPERIGVTYSQENLAAMPLLELLERAGTVAYRASQTVGAALASPEVAEALNLEIGSPLLTITRVVYDRSDCGIEHLHALYRPDRYALKMDLVRTGRSGIRRWKPEPERHRNQKIR